MTALAPIIESPPGVVAQTTSFAPGQVVRIGDKVLSSIWGPLFWVPVELYIYSPNGAFSPILISTKTDLLGDYWFDVQLPNVVGVAMVRISVTGMMGLESYSSEIPIGIGTTASPYNPPVPSPSPEPSPDPNPPAEELPSWLLPAGLAVAAAVVFLLANKAKGK